jgi:hypothetical protein
MTILPDTPIAAEAPPDRLTYNGRTVRRRGELLNLTSLWFAAGHPQNRRPTDWLALPETKGVFLHLRSMLSEATAMTCIDVAGIPGLKRVDADYLLVTTRGRRGGTWGHWELAISYAQYLSPPLHAWCNEVVRSRMEPVNGPCLRSSRSLTGYLDHQFERLQSRLDAIDQHASDLMFLATAGHELVFGNRRPFSGRSQAILCAVVALDPFAGRCPCCSRTGVLSPQCQPSAGAAFDHFFNRALNRPENGWLICAGCHDDLTRGGYLVRFSKIPAFRIFQAAVLAFKQAQYRSTDISDNAQQ